jgi:hypothetical protein
MATSAIETLSELMLPKSMATCGAEGAIGARGTLILPAGGMGAEGGGGTKAGLGLLNPGEGGMLLPPGGGGGGGVTALID